MGKILPILLTITVYLTPLYPVYALSPATDSPIMRPEKDMYKKDAVMDKIQDKMASREAELKKKLSKFKDKVKAKRVETINTNLNKVNERRVTHMNQVLEKISRVLENLKNKVEQAASNGKDLQGVDEAISDAQTQWSQANEAVKAQSAKDYSISINKESTVKEDAASARDNLRTDLKGVHTQVVEARQSLAKAIQAVLSSIKGGDNGPE